LEVSIYSFLTQLVREESDYKRIVGRKVLPVCNERLERIAEFKFSKVGDTSHCEIKFFKLMSVLIKKCKENNYLMRGMKKTLNNYLKSGYVQERKIEKKKIPYILD
jgi:hypothetical protein